MSIRPVRSNATVIPNDGDRSGATPGLASPNYEQTPTTNYAPAAFHIPPAHVAGSSTSVSQPNDAGQPNRTTYPEYNASGWTPDNYVTIAGGDGCSISHNGNQGRFDTTEGRGARQGTGGILTRRMYVAHDPGQVPETFTAQASHAGRWPDGSPHPSGGHASAFDTYGGTVPVQQLRRDTSRTAPIMPTPLFGFAARTDLLPDESGRATRLAGIIHGEGNGDNRHGQDRLHEPVRSCGDPSWARTFQVQEDLVRHPVNMFEVPQGGPQQGTGAPPVGGPQTTNNSMGSINPDLDAGSLSFCRGNAPTYDCDRGDVQRQGNPGMTCGSGLRQLASDVNSGG
jgi:hypothetical protein